MSTDIDERNGRRRTVDVRMDGRSISNTFSIILLVGMVVTGATVVLLVGGKSISTLQRGVNAESQGMNLREIDSKVSSLAFDANRDNTTLQFGDFEQQRVWIDEFGWVNVSMNRNPACSANVSFSSVRVEQSDGTVQAYEMGGIWTREEGSSLMESPPAVRYANGTLSMSVFNFSGRIQSEKVRLFKNVSRSDNRTSAIRSKLYGPGCQRIDNVTMVVRSDFYGAWYSYLQSEVNATSVTKYDSNSSVVVFLNQSRLPPYTNQSTNHIVDLNGTDYVDVQVNDNAIEVTKNASINYTVTLTPLAKGVQVGDFASFDSRQIYRPPVDVTFVIDESGSMSSAGPDGVQKYKAARTAMHTFLGLLNESRDRAGLVGFTWCCGPGYSPTYRPSRSARFIRADGQYLSSNFTAVNDSIETTDHSGSTQINAGLRRALAMMDLRSNNSRRRVMILLSDGKNDPNVDIVINGETYTSNEATKYWARRAAESGITVYTVGFGGGANETLLRRVANVTGGTYHFAANASQLDKVFKEIAASVTKTQAIARPPASMNVTAGSRNFYPQIDGQPKYVANATGPGGRPIYNINDPTAPAFSITFSVEDGKNISMSAVSYDCDDWAATDRAITNESNGQTYTVVRCADLNESSRTLVSPSNVTIYRDGDDISTLLDRANATDTWWQADLRNVTLLPYLRNGSTVLDLESNQAIVVFNYSDGGTANNRIVALLEIGNPERVASARGTVTVTFNAIAARSD